jgi:hypothetical protein
MNTSPRPLTSQELELVSFLLRRHGSRNDLLQQLDGLQVRPQNDGGMGSLQFLPQTPEHIHRKRSTALARADYVDADGVPVSIELSIDNNGWLYELDIWKVDFRPLVRYPTPEMLT